MRLTLLLWLNALAICVVLSSCEDHRLTQSPRFRLTKAIAQSPQSYSSTAYTYNSANRLAGYVVRIGATDAVETTPGQATIMQYDAQGHLISADKQAAASAYTMTRFTYGYDANGNIVSAKAYLDAAKTGTYTLTDEYLLEYGTTKYPIKVTQTKGTDQAVEQYTYTDGNVTGMTRKGNLGVNKFESVLNALPYDTKPNPFYGLITAGPDRLLYSKNNLMDGTLTYNANGLLSKKVTTTSAGVVTETYTYESY